MTAELQGIILSVSSIEEKSESPHVVCPPEEHTYFHHILSYYDAAAKFAVEKAIL